MQSDIIHRNLQLFKNCFFSSCSLTVPFHDSYLLQRLRSKYRPQHGFWKLEVQSNKRLAVTVLIPNPYVIQSNTTPWAALATTREIANSSWLALLDLFWPTHTLWIQYTKNKSYYPAFFGGCLHDDGGISKAAEFCSVWRELYAIPYCAAAMLPGRTLLIKPQTTSMTTKPLWEDRANIYPRLLTHRFTDHD